MMNELEETPNGLLTDDQSWELSEVWSEAFSKNENRGFTINTLRQGIRVVQKSLHLNRDVVFEHESTEAALEFGCLFSGFVSGKCKEYSRNRSFECGSGSTWLSFYQPSKNTIIYHAGAPIHSFCVHIDPGALRTYFRDAEDVALIGIHKQQAFDTVWSLNSIKSITPTVKSLIHQIHTCTYKGAMKTLFLESKVLELLVCLINDAPSISNKKRLNRSDEEKIHFAREVLIANLENPLPLGELAKKVGICTTKLNKGFRSLFNNSVFGLLRDERLAKARMLMETGQKTACEAAWEVGYSSLSSFHRAFFQKYGVNPGFYSKSETVR